MIGFRTGGRGRPDARGVTELPLRLLMTLIILGLSLPAVLGLLAAHSNSEVHRSVVSGIDRIFAAARQAFQGSNGTGSSVDVTFSSGFLKGIERIQIGDRLGGDSGFVARYTVSGEPERTIAIGELGVPMTSFANRALVLSDGRFRLVVQHWVVGSDDFVVVDHEEGQMNYGCFGPNQPPC